MFADKLFRFTFLPSPESCASLNDAKFALRVHRTGPDLLNHIVVTLAKATTICDSPPSAPLLSPPPLANKWPSERRSPSGQRVRLVFATSCGRCLSDGLAYYIEGINHSLRAISAIVARGLAAAPATDREFEP